MAELGNEPAFAGRHVDQPLHDIDRLGKARTAGDTEGRCVGEDTRDSECDRGDAVNRAPEVDVLIGLHASGADQLGTGVHDTVDA